MYANLMAVLGRYLSRATFRSLWGVLSLLPAPSGVYPGTRAGDPEPWPDDGEDYCHPCANFDLYDAEAYRLDLDPTELTRLQTVLDAAARFHQNLYAWHMGLDQKGLDQNQRDRMAVIAGVGYKTLFRLAYKKRLGYLWEYMDKTASRIEGDRHREGDGRVPLASAELEFVGETRYVVAEHGSMPSVPAVYRDVFRFLREAELELPESPKDALGGHLAADEIESVVPTLNRTVDDDPGYLQFDDPDPAQVDDLQAKVEAETIPEFRRIRIL